MDASTADQANQFADQQKRTGADRIAEIAKAVHRAADDIDGPMPGAAGYIHSAASRLEDGARALRERSLGDLMNDLNDFGRREPALLMGGAMLAGLVVSRFLKSSAGGRGSTLRSGNQGSA